MLGGHLDSWDLATGSVDDGAGVVMAMEAARLISVYAPDTRRTIRVVFFANEEFGLSVPVAELPQDLTLYFDYHHSTDDRCQPSTPPH